MTDLLYLRDAYLSEMDAVVVERDTRAVALDRTVFYPTGGGQPHDTGMLDGVGVLDVRKGQTPVTGGNTEPLSARMDFEFDPLPEGFSTAVEARVAAEIEAGQPIEVLFLPRERALEGEDLIRTRENLVPASVEDLRVVDIAGLDKQADGGTHVRSTKEIGRVRVVKTESKGRGNKRIRIQVLDA